MRRLGIFCWFGYDIPLEIRLSLIKEAGFRTTCLWLGPEEELVGQGRAALMPDLARQAGLSVDNVHATCADCNHLWDESDGDAQAALSAYEDALRFCKDHRIGTCVVHLTKGRTLPRMTQSGLRRIDELVRHAAALDVTLAIENMLGPEHIDLVLSNICSPHLGLCYDSSHDFLQGMTRSALLQKWGGRLVTTHFSDNHGEHDDHLLPGDGTINWNALTKKFPAKTYSGPIMLEVQAKQAHLSPEEFLRLAHERAKQLERLLTASR